LKRALELSLTQVNHYLTSAIEYFVKILNFNEMKKLTILLCVFLAIGVSGTFTFAQNNSKLRKKSIEFGKAKVIKTDIYFFAGELNINTSTNELAECLYG
jgi:hypothetical protein